MIITKRKPKKVKAFVLFFILPVFAALIANIWIKSKIGDKSIEHYMLNEIGIYTPSDKFQIEAQAYQEEIEKLKAENEHLRHLTSRGETESREEVKTEEVKAEDTKAKETENKDESFKKEKVVKAIANNLKGAFHGKAEYIYDTSKKYSVNPMLVAAICKHETGNGSSYAVVNFNNPGGLMGKKGLLQFKSLESGIEATIKNLKKLYIDCGLTTIEAIQKKYCPVGASNDPQGLNKYWLPMVTQNYMKILEESKI